MKRKPVSGHQTLCSFSESLSVMQNNQAVPTPLHHSHADEAAFPQKARLVLWKTRQDQHSPTVPVYEVRITGTDLKLKTALALSCDNTPQQGPAHKDRFKKRLWFLCFCGNEKPNLSSPSRLKLDQGLSCAAI